MLIKIDVVLIDKEFKVVGLRELLRPFRVIRPNFRAESVIELPAHTIFKSGTEVGDHLEIERYNRRSDGRKGPRVSRVIGSSEDTKISA